MLCSVRFVFVSTFNLQRGRAFVFGVINLNKFRCLCKGKCSDRPRVSEENVRLIQEKFESNLGKSTRTASRELGIPQPIVWRGLGVVHCSTESIILNQTFLCVCV